MAIHAGEKDLILGFDPGRDKTGFAFIKFSGELILSGIFFTNEQEKFFADLKNGSDLQKWIIEGEGEKNIFSRVKIIVIGDGTNSKIFSRSVSENFSLEIISVDEKNTTLEARNLYWELHAPVFWQKIFPKSLRVPPRVLDDLAAWSIAQRGAKKYRDIIDNRL